MRPKNVTGSLRRDCGASVFFFDAEQLIGLVRQANSDVAEFTRGKPKATDLFDASTRHRACHFNNTAEAAAKFATGFNPYLFLSI
jgi:hypothetical protein